MSVLSPPTRRSSGSSGYAFNLLKILATIYLDQGKRRRSTPRADPAPKDQQVCEWQYNVAQAMITGGYGWTGRGGEVLPVLPRHMPAAALEGEREIIVHELRSLQRNVVHIKVVISAQQAHADGGGLAETLTSTSSPTRS